MLEKQASMRNDGPSNWSYQDRVFSSEMNLAIQLTDGHYEAMMFREALRTGFYDLQVFFFFMSVYSSALNPLTTTGLPWKITHNHIPWTQDTHMYM